MKKTLTIIIVLIGMLFTGSIKAQENAVFEFDVFEKEKNVFEISFQFFEATDIKIIQMDLLEEGQMIDSREAILNRKADNNFYLFDNQKETLVYLDDLKMMIEKKWGKANPKTMSLEIRLLNEDFQLLTKNRKQIR